MNTRMMSNFLLITLTILTMLSVQTNALAQQNPYLDALPAWQTTLTKFVDEQGRTDFRALANDHAELSTFLAAIEQVSPKSHPALFPTKADILAYHINTYNALAMWGVIEREIPDNFSTLWKRASFFKFRKVRIGGKKTNLYDYENKVIRKLNEPRIHFVLNCMVKDCPRLPQTIFTAQDLEQQLQDASIEFFNKDLHIQIDEAAEEVALSGIMKFYTKDYVASGKKQDLIPYVNQYREDKIPLDYKVSFIDYDWTVNQQPE
ncbi:MAG: DUF547 domain-containing protein [Acidiferrobacterales bacterium]|nr:DUF547 domain-containing protein [Acidiferrobacterales bacterium]